MPDAVSSPSSEALFFLQREPIDSPLPFVTSSMKAFLLTCLISEPESSEHRTRQGLSGQQ